MPTPRATRRPTRRCSISRRRRRRASWATARRSISRSARAAGSSINFFQSSCVPCKVEHPALVEFVDAESTRA
ncbi:MAG: hypothetical protein WKF58_04660 [Ilumatobacteraceae bacterium]